MNNYQIFSLGEFLLQSGCTLRDSMIAYQTFGELSPDRNNVILYPTRFYGTHNDNSFLVGPGKALDPEKYFIVIPNLTGNGFSSSPSNSQEPIDRANFPNVSILDNVLMQRRLLREVFGVERLRLVVGWSMGAQQAYHWGALFPEEVERIAAIAGSAKTSPHNQVFLEGMKAALTADSAWKNGLYIEPPVVGLRAMGRCWAGWALSQAFYRQHLFRELGFASLEEFLTDFWEKLFLKRDANNMLAQIWTWQHSDISDNSLYNGDFVRALQAIKARTIVMPGETDLYFPPEDSIYEVNHLPNAELKTIPSVWGHYAGGSANTKDVDFVDNNLKRLLSLD
jgi:homoserine O-acetyltransferase